MEAFDLDMLDTTPDDLIRNYTNVMSYDENNDFPDEYIIDEYLDWQDFDLVPADGYKVDLYEDPDLVVRGDIVMDNLGDGINYAFFNRISYVKPKVPTLGTILSAPDDDTSEDETIYGSNTDTHVVKKDEIVEVLLNNNDTGKHPMHLHGHVFQVVDRGPNYVDEPGPINYNESAPVEYPKYPMMRDVVVVPPQSWVRFRFKGDNPGVWFMHCQKKSVLN
ncbi:unnamed protein product [Ambrosiozyma monospora]|uniref:Unnamed protein product n=1 Tax=Ambrosiozyma monospora TaxID=43982 RepID=A0A9W6WDK0_AMBMO|nr:unnamed protein product [Ambrosiozyma monospora]